MGSILTDFAVKRATLIEWTSSVLEVSAAGTIITFFSLAGEKIIE